MRRDMNCHSCVTFLQKLSAVHFQGQRNSMIILELKATLNTWVKWWTPLCGPGQRNMGRQKEAAWLGENGGLEAHEVMRSKSKHSSSKTRKLPETNGGKKQMACLSMKPKFEFLYRIHIRSSSVLSFFLRRIPSQFFCDFYPQAEWPLGGALPERMTACWLHIEILWKIDSMK